VRRDQPPKEKEVGSENKKIEGGLSKQLFEKNFNPIGEKSRKWIGRYSLSVEPDSPVQAEEDGSRTKARSRSKNREKKRWGKSSGNRGNIEEGTYGFMGGKEKKWNNRGCPSKGGQDEGGDRGFREGRGKNTLRKRGRSGENLRKPR